MEEYKIIEVPDLYYTGSGYLNFNTILKYGYPFTIIVSMRGGGKTYGALSWMLDNNKRFMYFRRTVKAAKIAISGQYNVFKKINTDRGIDIQGKYHSLLDSGEFTQDGEIIGYISSLSTFAALRSIDGSDIDFLIFDEFIPQPEERNLYNAFTAWSNADETINRNRESDGVPSVRRLLMANSDTIYGDIVAGYNIADALLWMQESGVEVIEFSPDIMLLRPRCDVLAERKKNTSLYRVTAGSEFSAVALENKFKIEDRERIKRQPIREYKPVCRIRGITIYKHKAGSIFYITRMKAGKPKEYDSTDTDYKRFLNENPAIWPAYLAKRIIFSDLGAQQIFLKLFNTY